MLVGRGGVLPRSASLRHQQSCLCSPLQVWPLVLGTITNQTAGELGAGAIHGLGRMACSKSGKTDLLAD
jgi:hypothetical protein